MEATHRRVLLQGFSLERWWSSFALLSEKSADAAFDFRRRERRFLFWFRFASFDALGEFNSSAREVLRFFLKQKGVENLDGLEILVLRLPEFAEFRPKAHCAPFAVRVGECPGCL